MAGTAQQQFGNPNNYSGIGGGFNPSGNSLSMFGNPGSFTAAASTQASDYDSIMAQYKNLASGSANNPIAATPIPQSNPQSSAPIAPSTINSPSASFTPTTSSTPTTYSSITPQLSTYNQGTDVTQSLSDLSNLTNTGGYSAADKANILSRDISPTTSIYANARQNADRQKAISGGYSPNSGAVEANMARDESNQISGISTTANAGIAQNVAANEIAAAPQYAQASAQANAARTAADQANTAIVNQINQANTTNKMNVDQFNTNNQTQVGEFNAAGQTNANELNANNQLQTNEQNAANKMQADQFNTTTANAIAQANADRNNATNKFNTQATMDAANANRQAQLAGIGGQTSLYGTTPALTNTFGNQVTQAANINQNQQQINNQQNANLYRFAGAGG